VFTLNTITFIGNLLHRVSRLPFAGVLNRKVSYKKRHEHGSVICISRYINARQLRYPLFAGSVLLLLAAVYSDANKLSIEPLVELLGIILIIMTAAIWGR